MEGNNNNNNKNENKNKKTGPSSSSFTSDLFGTRENSAPPSSSIFGSIFPRPNEALGRDSLQKHGSESQGTNCWSNEVYSESNETNPYYQEQRVQPPCHLSSSIYYGGQDVYSRPQSAQPHPINRDEGEDDSGSASRGNWWKGSLYY